MRKVFVFWGVILFVLIFGMVAVIYTKMLLKKEEIKGQIWEM